MLELNLGASLELLVDHRGKTPKKLGGDFVLSGVPVISAQAVVTGRVQWDDLRCVTEEMADKWMPQPMREGDVLLTSEAPLGKVARVDRPGPIVLGQRVFGLRGLGGVLDSGYLFYALQTPLMQSRLAGRSTGTTVLGIRQSALRGASVPAPSWTEQRAIAEVLGALDDKIAANDRLVAVAESLIIARASQEVGRCRISDVAEHLKKSLSPSLLGTSPVNHYSLPAFDARRLPSVEVADSILSSKFDLASPAVLLSKLNPRFPRVWDVPSPISPAVASTEFVVLQPREVSTSVLWAVLSQPGLGQTLLDKASGTSGSHQRVRPQEILDAEISDPRALPTEVAELITSLGSRVQLARRESQGLGALRDALLPELMSGRLRVKDAEKSVEGVV